MLEFFEETSEEAHPDLRAVLTRLMKGDSIPLHEIERLYQVNRDTEQFRLVALQLRRMIEHEFASREPSQIVCVRFDSRIGLVVLTDDEAVEHTNRGTIRHVRGMRRTHRKRVGIDRSAVAETQRSALDRALEVGGRMLQVLGRELRRRPVLPSAAKRQKPVR